MLFLLFIFNLYAKVISCTHPALCEVVSSVLDEKDIQIESPIIFGGDPHHFEPSPSTIKKLYQSDLLISGPTDLHRWWKSGARSEKEIVLTIDADRFKLSHFWLYPEINCQLKKRAFEELAKKNLKVIPPTCTQTSMMVKNIANKAVILGHDALTPLIEDLKGFPIALKGSHHHDEISPATLKKVALLLAKETRVIWILDKGSILPPSVSKLIRKTDLVYEIDVEKRGKESGDSIEALLKKIESDLCCVK